MHLEILGMLSRPFLPGRAEIEPTDSEWDSSGCQYRPGTQGLTPLPGLRETVVVKSGRTALGFACAFYLFGFFEDADSHLAPRRYRRTTVGAGNETLVCRTIWDYEFIASTLRASEWGVRHGACSPFWSALANLVSPTEAMGCTIMRPNG